MILEGGGLTHWGDITVLLLYFILVLAVGMWSLCRPNRGSAQGYFLAGRDMLWWPVGASLFASNIGSEHFIGLAGTGAASGIAIVVYEWLSLPLAILLTWVFLPVYISAGVYTLPEYLEKRFSSFRLRLYISCLTLVLYVITKIAVSMYAGALFIQMAIGWDIYASVVLLLGVTAVYTVLGGLAAVIYTDTFQTAIMMIGSVTLTVISFNQVGGYEGLLHLYKHAIPDNATGNSTCGYPRDDAFHIFRDPVTADNPWPGLFLQASVGCMWYWCADQVMVQRTLAAKNLSHAQGGGVLAGYLKLLPIFLMIFPGMISRVLYPDEVGCLDAASCDAACQNPAGCSNIAYPMLVLRLLPVGLRGLLMAVMMSAIMSSLTSIFNSSSTVFAMDIWTKIRPKSTERELLVVGRVCIVVLCVISIFWLPLVQSSAGGQLFVYIQAVQGYLGTPVGALFLISIFWPNMTEKGAFLGIVTGHACGVTRLILDFIYPEPKCGEVDTRPSIVAEVHYTYMGQLIFLCTTLVIIVVSCFTKSTKIDLGGLTWNSRFTKPVGEEPDKEDIELEVAKKVDSVMEQMDNKITDSIEVEAADEHTSVWQRCSSFLFGSPSSHQVTHVKEAWSERMSRLHQTTHWQTILNINAGLAIAIMAFLMGWFH